jgi:hypothetical protein
MFFFSSAAKNNIPIFQTKKTDSITQARPSLPAELSSE